MTRVQLRRRLMTLVFALGFLLIPGGAESHELDSATLSLREVEAEQPALPPSGSPPL